MIAVRVVDCNGRVFWTVREMCEAWGVSTSAFSERRRNGWTLEECLTGIRSSGARDVADHLGYVHRSVSDMCGAWKVSPERFRRRREMGWTLEQALTGKGPAEGGSL